jgi:tRNA-specific 2-thiouridylase
MFFMTKKEPKKIFVGVSGGVDSSVSAALLKEQGHEVVGVFIRTWQPDWLACTWKEERRDAMRVCAHLDIPFVELDLEKEYKEGVADYMIREYQAGRTPNPDVMCNKEVKFGGFLTWALEHGADYVATGHYVQRQEQDGEVQMLRGVDTAKDQSYFLWTLLQEQLKHILFPVGHLKKSEVRKEAERFGLPTASKKDSQGICFIGDIDMKEFLSHYIDEKPGKVRNTNGEDIGTHRGVLFYTYGERHGFEIDSNYKGSDDTPYYVVSKDVENNILTVSQDPQGHVDENSKELKLQDVVDNTGSFKEGEAYTAQIRYRGEHKEVTLDSYNIEEATAVVSLKEADPSIATGQSLVIYHGYQCLGGGVIQ